MKKYTRNFKDLSSEDWDTYKAEIKSLEDNYTTLKKFLRGREALAEKYCGPIIITD